MEKMEMMVQIEHPTREGEKEQMFKGIIVTAYTSLIVYMNLSIYGSLNKHPGTHLGLIGEHLPKDTF